MKKIFSFIGAALIGIFAMTSCSPDDFGTVDPNGIPSLEGVEPVVQVDQTINQVTFSLPENCKGVMPIWIFDGKTYSTVNGLKKIFTSAGDYTAEFKLMNKNGISDGSKSFTFHVDNTIFNFDKYYTLMCGGAEGSEATKEWRIDNKAKGHMGCGEPGTTGTNWWSANEDDKAAFGVYDNRITFGANNTYTFDPGEAGTMYVNHNMFAVFPDTDGNMFGAEPNDDYCTNATAATVEYKFEVVGDDLFLVLPAHTPFPYIPNSAMWDEPRFKVESITPSTINLVCDTGDIAWHFILTSGAAEVKFKGFKYDSEFNMWKAADAAHTYTQYNACTPSWSPATTPEVTDNHDGQYSFTLVEETAAQWQSQFAIVPDAPIALSSANHYDYSVIINPTNNIDAATVKLTEDGNDGNFLFEQKVALTAYEDNVIWFYDLPGIDAAKVKMVFDFAPAPANTTVNIKNIVLKDHANDDGTVLPSDEPGDEPGAVEWNGKNLLEGMPVEITQYYAPGWNPLGDAEYSAVDGKYTISYPSATDSQWQAQFTFNNTGIALDPSKTYDFRCKIVSNSNHPGVTVKLTQQDDDNTFLTADRHAIKAYEETWIELVDLPFTVTGDGKGVINNLKMPFDFGGCAEGTEIVISDMYLQEHTAPKAIVWDANSDANLWKNATPTLSEVYHADGGWAPYPAGSYTASVAKDKISFHMDQATASQWQAQLKIDTGIKQLDPSKKYHFRCKFNANKNLNKVTVKLCELGPNDTPGSLGINYDANTLFYDNSTNLAAFEDVVFQIVDNDGITLQDNPLMIVFDFGGSPENFDVDITDIILLEE